MTTYTPEEIALARKIVARRYRMDAHWGSERLAQSTERGDNDHRSDVQIALAAVAADKWGDAGYYNRRLASDENAAAIRNGEHLRND